MRLAMRLRPLPNALHTSIGAREGLSINCEDATGKLLGAHKSARPSPACAAAVRYLLRALRLSMAVFLQVQICMQVFIRYLDIANVVAWQAHANAMYSGTRSCSGCCVPRCAADTFDLIIMRGARARWAICRSYMRLAQVYCSRAVVAAVWG